MPADLPARSRNFARPIPAKGRGRAVGSTRRRSPRSRGALGRSVRAMRLRDAATAALESLGPPSDGDAAALAGLRRGRSSTSRIGRQRSWGDYTSGRRRPRPRRSRRLPATRSWPCGEAPPGAWADRSGRSGSRGCLANRLGRQQPTAGESGAERSSRSTADAPQDRSGAARRLIQDATARGRSTRSAPRTAAARWVARRIDYSEIVSARVADCLTDCRGIATLLRMR